MLWALIGGIVVGVVAKGFMPEPRRSLATIELIGIISALAAYWIGESVGLYQSHEAVGFVPAMVGSGIVLTVFGFRGHKI